MIIIITSTFILIFKNLKITDYFRSKLRRHVLIMQFLVYKYKINILHMEECAIKH